MTGESRMGSIEEILDFAIGEEDAARAFYEDLAKSARGGMREVFEGFAREEKGHKAKLEAMRRGHTRDAFPSKKVADLGIADYLVDVEPSPGMGYQDALVLAMKKEKAAFRMYTLLASAAPAGEIRDTLLGLAQEEAKHKLRFEIEYDDNVLTED